METVVKSNRKVHGSNKESFQGDRFVPCRPMELDLIFEQASEEASDLLDLNSPCITTPVKGEIFTSLMLDTLKLDQKQQPLSNLSKVHSQTQLNSTKVNNYGGTKSEESSSQNPTKAAHEHPLSLKIDLKHSKFHNTKTKLNKIQLNDLATLKFPFFHVSCLDAKKMMQEPKFELIDVS